MELVPNNGAPTDGAAQQTYDVVIVGGSFAGLAAAMQLRGRRVLLIDRRPIGAHQTSTCAVPLALIERLGAHSSILQVLDSMGMHSGKREFRFPMPEPYATFDYYAFCQAMLAQTDVELLIANATPFSEGAVVTTQGTYRGRFTVDASGWQSIGYRRPPAQIPSLGYGVETELPVRLPLNSGFHFYFDKSLVGNGYAWVFPCGETTRIGLCAFDKGVQLGPVLDLFLARFGLTCGTTHGGAMPVARRQPLVGELMVVGDAAGQCLPLWAEGIRMAVSNATECGRAISDALDGLISDKEARARYAAFAEKTATFQRFLLKSQKVTAATPQWLRTTACVMASWPPLTKYLVGIYLKSTGWPQAYRLLARAVALDRNDARRATTN